MHSLQLFAALQNLGRLTEAIDSYTFGVALKPDFSEVYSNLGVAHHDNGSLDAAVKAFEIALRSRPHGVIQSNIPHSGSGQSLRRRILIRGVRWRR